MPDDRTDDPILTTRFAAALQLAFEVHRTQVRKSTAIPYISHVMAVCGLVLEAGGDEDCAIAALLHDSVEDSPEGAAMLDRLREQFGVRVAGIVEACSDSIGVPGGVKEPWDVRKQRYLEHLGGAGDDALLVSACDKLHNARAIVADLRGIGVELWERFSTKGGSKHLWYYRSVYDILATRGRPSLANQLRDAVIDMTELERDLEGIDEKATAWLSRAVDARSSGADVTARGAAQTPSGA